MQRELCQHFGWDFAKLLSCHVKEEMQLTALYQNGTMSLHKRLPGIMRYSVSVGICPFTFLLTFCHCFMTAALSGQA